MRLVGLAHGVTAPTTQGNSSIRRVTRRMLWRFVLGVAALVAFISGTDMTVRAAGLRALEPGYTGQFLYRNDNFRTGQNLAESVLTPSTVTASRFGLLFSDAIDGYAYAEPLYVPNVQIPNKGAHNVVYVATENDSVYAFDADQAGPALWHTSFINPAGGITAVPASDLGSDCTDLVPIIGITATPVIDPNTGTLYVVSKVKLGPGEYQQQLHALDIKTGLEKLHSPVTITASVPGTASDGLNGVVSFNPLLQLGRPALTLSNGEVYLTFASHCDIGPWHGWILGYDETSLAQEVVYNTTPNGIAGGIWEAGCGPGVDTNGDLIAITSNGTFDTGASPVNYGDSFLRLTPDPGAPVSMSVTSFFTPLNELMLEDEDLDMGSGGNLLLPDQPGPNPHLMVGAGKLGSIYLVDRDSMGGFNASQDQMVQELPSEVGGMFSTPAYWRGTVPNVGLQNMIYTIGAGDTPKTFVLFNGLIQTPPASVASNFTFGFPGGSPVISANGTTSGILWAIDSSANPHNGPAILYAFDATNLAELYDSTQFSSDNPGQAVKFTVPTVANGSVYVGTQTQMAVFGLFSGGVRPTPTASATPTATLTLSPTATRTATATATATRTATPTTTATATRTATATLTAIATATATPTATSTPSGGSCSGASLVNDQQSSNLPSGTTVTYTMATAPQAGNDLIVSFAEYQTPGDVSAVSMVGGVTTACSLALGPIDSDVNFSFYQYYCNNVPSGTTGIKFTQGASGDTEIVDVEQLSGAGTLSVDQIANAHSFSSSLSTGTTSTLATLGDWAVAGCELGSGTMSSTAITAGPTNSYTGSAGIVSSTTVTNMGLVAAHNSAVGPTGTGTTWTWSAADAHDCGVVAYKCASAQPTATATVTRTATPTASATPTATATTTVLVTASVAFGNVAEGQAGAKTLTVNNTGATNALVISQASSSDPAEFAVTNGGTCGAIPVTLAAKTSCTLGVGFTPTAVGAHSATLTLTDNGGTGSQNVSLTGTGIAALTTTKSSLVYGNVKFGLMGVNVFSAINHETQPVSLSESFSGTNAADFSITGGTCTSTLAANTSCTINVTFTPGALGTESATLSVADSPDPLSPYTVALSTGPTIPATVTPVTLAYGTLTSKVTSKTLNATVTNLSGYALPLSKSISGANAGDFAVTGGTCTATAAPNSSCTVAVTFTPTGGGSSESASMTLNVGNDPSSPHSISLTGTGH